MKIIYNSFILLYFLVILTGILFFCDYGITETEIRRKNYPNLEKFENLEKCFRKKNIIKKILKQKIEILIKKKTKLSGIFYLG